MGIRIKEKIARWLAPEMRGEDEIRALIQDEVRRAKMALPITANYDPNNEGYRRITGDAQRRDLTAITQDRMFEIAYYMMDNSAMMKRLARMDKTFLFSEPISITCADSDVQTVVDRFWDDAENCMQLKFPEKIMWLGILGEQCWPVDVNPENGHVRVKYLDPSLIREVFVLPDNIEQPIRVDVQGLGGRAAHKMSVIRFDNNFSSQKYGRLVGDCFFFAINHPPNSPRGRSDFLTLFDWIDGLERYGFNFLERSEFMLNFVWDVLLKGMNEDQIREWLQNNPAPEPGSIRAHNENVEWNAVSPDIKAHDFRGGFDMGKSFVMGAAGRPESWFGGGGKAYSTEADIFGQVPIKDLDERQLVAKHIATQLVQFQIDQAVIAGRLSDKKDLTFSINMAEISKKDFTKLVNGIPQLTTALTLAESNGWLTTETAAAMFAAISGQMGFAIDAAAEVQAANKNKNDMIDYDKMIQSGN